MEERTRWVATMEEEEAMNQSMRNLDLVPNMKDLLRQEPMTLEVHYVHDQASCNLYFQHHPSCCWLNFCAVSA